MTASERSEWVAGVDGCRGGWVVALRHVRTAHLRVEVEPTFAAVIARPEAPAVIAVDIPIGLPEQAVRGGRQVDKVARMMLRGKASSLFNAPSRAAMASFLAGGSHAEVSAAERRSGPDGIGVSLQTYAIVKKIAEVDEHMTAALQDRVIEVHPELCFAQANRGDPILARKSDALGRSARMRLLIDLGILASEHALPRCPGAQPDDVLDALIACWTAARVRDGRATRIPEVPPLDERGLRMEMWW